MTHRRKCLAGLWRGIALLVLLVPTGAHGEGETISESLRRFLDWQPVAIEGEPVYALREIEGVYRERGFAPLWIERSRENGEMTFAEKANALLRAIYESPRDGLFPEDYHSEALQKRLARGDRTPEELAITDVLLSDAFLRLGTHLSVGKVDPPTVDANWAIRRPPIAMRRQLERISGEETIERLLRPLPASENYRALQDELGKYRKLSETGGFTWVPPGTTLKRGSRGDRVAKLAERLTQEGYRSDLGALPFDGTFDEKLEESVKEFQETHGIEADGVVGLETIAELNVTETERARQLVVNLERLRWLPREPEGTFLFIDIAGYALTAFEAGVPVLSMRIVVGNDFRETPVLVGHLSSLVLNPTWLIPKSIALEELIPALRKNPRALRRKGIRVFERNGKRNPIDPSVVDWNLVDGNPVDSIPLPYLFEQPPGPRNPLGAIKFVLPNAFSVYLHGTAEPHLFDRSRRTLSHGCIRVENPVALAAFVLKGEGSPWTEETLTAAIKSGASITLSPPSSIPVWLWYQTASVGADRRVHFQRDIYFWDTLLWNALVPKERVGFVDSRDKMSRIASLAMRPIAWPLPCKTCARSEGMRVVPGLARLR